VEVLAGKGSIHFAAGAVTQNLSEVDPQDRVVPIERDALRSA
jgi:hypothetical protein